MDSVLLAIGLAVLGVIVLIDATVLLWTAVR